MAKRHRREDIEELLRRRERQGLTYRELSEISGVPVPTLAWWLRRLEREAADPLSTGELVADLLVEAERTAQAKGVQGEIVLTPPKNAKRSGGRRKRHPEHLPHVATTYELPKDQRSCSNCGGRLHEMGHETTRELERLETAIVHEIRRGKYACRTCTDGVVTAPGPDRVIEKGILGPGFLASVAVERFGNHMPYNRLEKSTPPRAWTCLEASSSGRWRHARSF